MVQRHKVINAFEELSEVDHSIASILQLKKLKPRKIYLPRDTETEGSKASI